MSFQRKRIAKEMSAIIQVSTSMSACCPSWTSTPVMSARAAALTPFKSVAVQADLRRRVARGWIRGIKTNEGRKIASVASIAPGQPPRR